MYSQFMMHGQKNIKIIWMLIKPQTFQTLITCVFIASLETS